MKLIHKAITLPFLFCISCKSKKETSTFESMNEGYLINKESFFFSIPFQNSSDSAAIVLVNINGKKKRFMIDTGAPLAISQALQKELQFPILLSTNLKDSNGDTARVEIVRTNNVSIGQLQFKDIPALILDFQQPVFSCDSIDGLIGSNLLRLLAIQFNKPEQKIYFSSNVDSFHFGKTTFSTEMELNKVQSDPVIKLGINQLVDDSTLYDSGDKTLYTISKFKLDSFIKKEVFINKIIATGTGVSSQGIVAKRKDTVKTCILKVDFLLLGKAAIKNIYTEPTPAIQSRMGRGLWNYGLVTLDYPQKQFYFTPYNKEQEMIPVSHYGFYYQERDGKLLVSVVWNNSKAFEYGLKPGCEIIQFGNFIPANVSKCEWPLHCKNEAEASVILIKYINEKGEIKECNLKKITLNKKI